MNKLLLVLPLLLFLSPPSFSAAQKVEVPGRNLSLPIPIIIETKRAIANGYWCIGLQGVLVNDRMLDDFNPETTVCTAGEASLSVDIINACNESLLVTWYLDGDEKADKEGPMVNYTWEKEGEYEIKVRASGVVSGLTAEKVYKINVLQNKADFVVLDDTVDQGKGEMLTIVNLSSKSSELTWDLGDGTIMSSKEDTIRHFYKEFGGIKKIGLVAKNDDCVSEKEMDVLVQLKDTIPPVISFDHIFGLPGPDEKNDTMVVYGVSCKVLPPVYGYYTPSFPEGYSSPTPKVFDLENFITPQPEVKNTEIVDYENISLTTVWTASDASGNTTRYYFIVRYNGNRDNPSIDGVKINNFALESDSDRIYTVCANEVVTLEERTSNHCSDAVWIDWYLDGDSKADSPWGWKWEKAGEYQIRVKAVGDVFGGAVENTYKVKVKAVTLAPEQVTEGQLNKPYGPVSFAASGGTAPYTYTFTGTLPKGMTFDVATTALKGTPTETGNFSFTITATESTTDQRTCTGSLTYSLSVVNPVKQAQTIAFPAIADKTYGDAPFPIAATASSTLPVTLAISTTPAGIAKLSDVANGKATITIEGTGTVTLTASQAGDSKFNVAPVVERTFTVNKASQVITFAPPPDKYTTDASFTLEASANTGLPIVFYLLSGPATLSGNTVTLTGQAGSVTIRARQAGNQYYQDTYVERTFKVEAVLGLETQLTATTKLYPNPATHTLTIELPPPLQKATLRLITAQGSVVAQVAVNHRQKVELPVGQFAKGVYVVQVSNDKAAVNKKVVIL